MGKRTEWAISDSLAKRREEKNKCSHSGRDHYRFSTCPLETGKLRNASAAEPFSLYYGKPSHRNEAYFEDDNNMPEELEDEKLKACLRLLHLAGYCTAYDFFLLVSWCGSSPCIYQVDRLVPCRPPI